MFRLFIIFELKNSLLKIYQAKNKKSVVQLFIKTVLKIAQIFSTPYFNDRYYSGIGNKTFRAATFFIRLFLCFIEVLVRACTLIFPFKSHSNCYIALFLSKIKRLNKIRP